MLVRTPCDSSLDNPAQPRDVCACQLSGEGRRRQQLRTQGLLAQHDAVSDALRTARTHRPEDGAAHTRAWQAVTAAKQALAEAAAQSALLQPEQERRAHLEGYEERQHKRKVREFLENDVTDQDDVVN